MQENKYITVAYELYTDNEKGIHELVEKAPVEHPFQFITNMGVALDAFEAKVAALAEGENFDFTLTADEAYGPYEEAHVIDLDKEIFCIDGRFDKNTISGSEVLVRWYDSKNEVYHQPGVFLPVFEENGFINQ